VFKETSAEELTETINSYSICKPWRLKLLLIDVITINCCSHEQHWKIWRMASGPAKDKTLEPKRFLSPKNDVLTVANGDTGCAEIGVR